MKEMDASAMFLFPPLKRIFQIRRKFENGLGFSTSFSLVFDGFSLYNKAYCLKVYALCSSPLVIHDSIS
jgi:hypothetical protein